LQFPDKNYDYHLAFSADCRTLVSEAREDDKIRTWDVLTGRQLREIQKPTRQVLAFAPWGKWMAGAERGFQSGLDLDDVATGAKVRTLRGQRPGDSAAACAFSPDGKLVATHSGFGHIDLWDPDKAVHLRRLMERPPGGGGAFALIVFSPDGTHL